MEQNRNTRDLLRHLDSPVFVLTCEEYLLKIFVKWFWFRYHNIFFEMTKISIYIWN